MGNVKQIEVITKFQSLPVTLHPLIAQWYYHWMPSGFDVHDASVKLPEVR
jgi:hypothetical protein